MCVASRRGVAAAWMSEDDYNEWCFGAKEGILAGLRAP